MTTTTATTRNKEKKNKKRKKKSAQERDREKTKKKEKIENLVGRRKDASSAAALLAGDQVLCRSEHEIYIYAADVVVSRVDSSSKRKRPCVRTEEFRWDSEHIGHNKRPKSKINE